MTTPALDVKVGLCGFSMKMAEYPRHFPLVEVQQTFYQPPGDDTLQRWRAQAPADFEFTVKAWQLITHTASSATYRRLRRPLTAAERAGLGGFRPTAIVQEGWQRTLRCAQLLSATAVLFQCPASFRPLEENLAHLRRFFGRLRRPRGMRLLWEPRGDAWPGALVATLCRELELVHVVDPFVHDATTPAPCYFRLHGLTGSRHTYSDADLRRLRTKVAGFRSGYVLFNNLPRVGDAQRFASLLTSAGT